MRRRRALKRTDSELSHRVPKTVHRQKPTAQRHASPHGLGNRSVVRLVADLDASKNETPNRLLSSMSLRGHAGNRAVARLVADLDASKNEKGRLRSAPERRAPTQGDGAGLAPDVTEETTDRDVGGRTFGETLGDLGRPVGTAFGDVVGGIAGALTGVSIGATTTTAPAWNPHGHFRWEVGWNTTGRSGWIVQKVVSTRRAEDAAGNALPDPLTRSYFEAWAVDAAGNVTPGGGTNDTWQRRSWGPSTQGHWSMKGTVFFTTVDPATQGFTPGGVPEAGILLSTTTPGAGLDLGVARDHRYAQGTWDSTGATPTHSGSAR